LEGLGAAALLHSLREPRRGTADLRSDDELVAVLKAVAHPIRLRIVSLLCGGERHVNALADDLGAPQAIVSQQLRILRTQGIVAASRVRGFAVYRLQKQALHELIRFARGCAAVAEHGAAPRRARTAARAQSRRNPGRISPGRQ
jgi:ArsR family transcriptional regulator